MIIAFKQLVQANYLLIFKIEQMKNIKKIAVVLSSIVLFAATANAGSIKNSVPVTSKANFTEPLSVSFLGEDANYLYFRVSVAAGSKKNAYFTVSDMIEGELYSTVFSNDNVQTYKIEKREGQVLDFSLQSGKKFYSKSFSSLQKRDLAKL